VRDAARQASKQAARPQHSQAKMISEEIRALRGRIAKLLLALLEKLILCGMMSPI